MTVDSNLARSAATHGPRPAVVDPSGRTLSYEALEALAEHVAGYLQHAGVVPGDRVGVIAPKSADVVAILFGIMRAGAAYVPADYTAPASRNRTVLADCAVRLVFLSPACAEIVDAWPADAPAPLVVWLPAPDDAGVTGALPPGAVWREVAVHPPMADPRPVVDADDLAYILYTSGSTGVPKGVMLSHRNATSFVDWCSEAFAPTADDRFSSHAPFHFDLSILDLYVPLKHGATLYLVSEEVGKNPQALAAFIAGHRLTVWYSTPSILALLSQFGNLDAHDCSTLRLVLFAGEVFPVKHLRAVVARWPHAAFYNLYGPTETNVCTYARMPPVIPDDRVEPYPIGPPCSHCAALVLDEPDGAEVAGEAEGLLYIAGPSVFRGYWGRETPELFVERGGRRWYNTGDVVQDSPDGFIYRGRRDRMVKRRGYRIELAEIERGLYQHPAIREAAVVALPDPAAGVRIVAHLVSREGARPSIIELKTFCGRVLPASMNPDAFVYLDALPRTSTDKVAYQALVASHAGAVPGGPASARHKEDA